MKLYQLTNQKPSKFTDYCIDVKIIPATAMQQIIIAARKTDYMTDFAGKVLQVVKRIPQGSVLTYKQVAAKAGRPQAYRAVGNILSRNYNPAIPCHRVIRSDGRLGSYNRGAAAKKKILKNEGFELRRQL